MLIKAADDKTDFLAELRTRSQGRGPHAQQAARDLARWEIGIAGEQAAAYLIDFDYDKAKPHWAVIHDLRLEHDGRIAQIDHLLINRLLEIYVLESKNYNCNLNVNARGEFTARYGRKEFGVPSPLEQNERHISVLRDVCETLDLPERLGLRLRPSFESYVLVSANAKLTLPRSGSQYRRVIKADQLTRTLTQRLENLPVATALGKAAKMISNETLHALARQLASRHRPLTARMTNTPEVAKAPPAIVSLPTAPPVTPQPTLPGPTCKACGKGAGSILHGQYGYYFKCAGCEANTAIRFTCHPGHKPRLRKAGAVFFRDCAECGSSEPFHANPEAR